MFSKQWGHETDRGQNIQQTNECNSPLKETWDLFAQNKRLSKKPIVRKISITIPASGLFPCKFPVGDSVQ